MDPCQIPSASSFDPQIWLAALLVAMGKKKPAKSGDLQSKKPSPRSAVLEHRECLLKEGQLTGTFKQCLVEIFSRFDADGDRLLSEEELQAFSRSANKEGKEFTAEDFSDMKDMFEWLKGPNGLGLSLRGFVQMYTKQTECSEEESWSDLSQLGYDKSLKRKEQNSEKDEKKLQGDLFEVSDMLQKFSQSSDEFISFPAQPTTREAICQRALSLGFECRILQLDGSERLSIFKAPESPETPGEGVSSPVSDKPDTPCTPSAVNPVFSALELDNKSCKLLQDVFKDAIPNGWKIYAHHMTICLGGLLAARSNGNSLSGDLQDSIRRLKAKEQKTIKVVSIGKGKGVVALGVVGCPSVNPVPHITLACANSHKPVESNAISSWEQLSDFHVLTGCVKEFEQRDASAGLTAATLAVHEDLVLRLKNLEAEVLAARAIHFMKIQDSDEQTLRRAIQEREQELLNLKPDDDTWEVAKAVKGGKAPKGKENKESQE